MNKISDYVLISSVLKKICKASQCNFIDVPISFSGNVEFKNGIIYAGEPKSLVCLFNIIFMQYLNNFNFICDKELDQNYINNSIVLFSTYLRTLSFSNEDVKADLTEPLAIQRLYQHRFPWLIMYDIIGPAFQVPIVNHKIISYNSWKLDIAVFNQGEVQEDSFVVRNTGIEYRPCLDAAFIVESIKLHGLEPFAIISEIIGSDIFVQFKGLVDLAYLKDKEACDFMGFLLAFAGIDDQIYDIETMGDERKKIANEINKIYKHAQVQNSGNAGQVDTPWWFFGLLERMLTPARGADWSTYERLEPYVKALWDKVEKVRKERGLTGLSYEALLRVKDGDNENEPAQTLEALLGANRVW